MKSGITHVVPIVPVKRTVFESETIHDLVHGNAFPASPVERQLFYRDDLHQWYQYNGTDWVSLTVGDRYTDAEAVAAMGAKADVNPLHHDKYTHPAGIQCTLTEPDIPAAIARDAEVDTKVSDHAALTTGVHGVGARHVAETTVEDLDLAAHHTRHEYAGADELSGLVVGLAAPTCVYRPMNVSSTPRTAVVSAVAGDVITLTANVSYYFWWLDMDSNVYLKIANTTKAPSEYAWVKARPAANQLQVTVAADIAGWVPNDVISTAEDGAASVYVELDISPSVPATATLIVIFLQGRDSGVIASWKGTQAFDTPDGQSLNLWFQVSGIANSMQGILPISGQKYYVKDVATGVGTLDVGHYLNAFAT